jgi:hypothetical protein
MRQGIESWLDLGGTEPDDGCCDNLPDAPQSRNKAPSVTLDKDMAEEIFDLVRDGTKRAQRRSAFLNLVCLPRGHTDAEKPFVRSALSENAQSHDQTNRH